jgi:Flp pilus assembly protein TadG
LLPLLLLLLGGILDFGRLVSASSQLNQAAREGARLAALGYSGADVSTRVHAATGGMENAGAVSAAVTTACPTSGTITTEATTVTVTYPYRFLVLDGVMNLFGGGWGSSMTLTAKGSMRCTG